MLSLLSIRNISLALGCLLISGCAEFKSGWDGNSARSNTAYAHSDLDELLVFGANMSKISPSSRTEVCRMLLKNPTEPPETEVLLHQMIGRLLSDSCGDIPDILDGLSALPPGSLPDERMQRLVAIHTEALKRIQALPRKSVSSTRKQKTARSAPDTKDSSGSKSSTGSNNDETRLLREKLEAIRSMEKHLDENDGGN